MKTIEELSLQLDRDEIFKAAFAAVNALLIAKGIYTTEEFESYFRESLNARIKKLETLL